MVFIEAGTVLESGVFTSPEIVPYWNTTYYLVVENESGFLSRYAELEEVNASPGDRAMQGQFLGRVGQVLNPERIDCDAPRYIRRLKDSGCNSMLHFELYRSMPNFSKDYLGGNWFGIGMPTGLLDPMDYLLSCDRICQ